MTHVGIASATSEFTYDNNTGQRTGSLSPLRKLTEYEYYNGGNLRYVRQYGPMPGEGSPTPTALAVTEYTYDERNYGSNLTGVRDAVGLWTLYEYDLEGRLTSEKLCNAAATPTPIHESSYTYDSTMGRLESKTDFKGQKVEFEYDGAGRLDKKVWYNASQTPTPVMEIEYTYDDYAQVTAIAVDSCGGGCDDTINGKRKGLFSLRGPEIEISIFKRWMLMHLSDI